ncbi:serine/threonine-protein kinase [Mycolicibacterium moriokaense]|uniref:non-specific serine/threonine protein kinase n=1 Tax=Mycolicibacterium moriokaense TaxID=39691 RepID=A0A318HD47_9MYCO|nr:serine/threonine-protein kinase [Mycolicibacterium moriokaense]PXX06329.1 serine/threonine-protein kinase PknG [Mycolicibacterium moriokaense]
MTCAEPGCDGTVVTGYCDLCGTAPATGAPDGPATVQAEGDPCDGSVQTARAASSRSASTRGRLGAGIVAIPRVPKGDPAGAILSDPQVPEGRRFCGNSECKKPVGRSRDGQPGLAEGFCTQCGTRYSFVPKLSRGDIVGGQYEVRGCLAHGGLGWIYLALDRNVHNRWVVLKGLLNSGDADAMAVAAAEVRTLQEVDHPNIVKIYNFVEHVHAGATAPVGYIVMEFIGGTTLKQIRNACNGPLPAAQAVAYIVEIASALDYLHAEGLAYCDFKPDNVMQSDEQLKLIDLGAVIAMDDDDSAIFGTPGYQAPEIAYTGATVASDVYTVGRTLAVLLMDVPQERGRFVEQLPGPATVPVLAEHESLYRALVRATDPEPSRRFSSMAEMADQLTGVLHEIVAAEKNVAQPRKSNNFSPQRGVFGVGRDTPVDPARVVAALPVPVVDPNDRGAALLATTSGTPPAQLEQALSLARGGSRQGNTSSVEIPLRLVRASLEIGAVKDARKRLAELESVLPGDWRLPWYRGQCSLLDGEFDDAAADFDKVLAILPGELGPKLAIAATAELRKAHEQATRYYETIWRTEHSYYSAAFGLARQRVRAGDRANAIAVLDEIPASSAHFTAAGAAAIEILLDCRTQEDVDEQTLVDAGNRAEALTLESTEKRVTIRLQVLAAALDWLQGGNESTVARLLGTDFDEPGIRMGMDRCYRELARGTANTWERIALVEKANAIRPRTRI